MNAGIVTIAFGGEYDKIAAACMRYSRQFTDLPICVVTNIVPVKRDVVWGEVTNTQFVCFENAPQIQNRLYKMNLPWLSPFACTIYMDADALIQKEGVETLLAGLQYPCIFNLLHHWISGDKVPNIYARAMRATKTDLPIKVCNGGFFAWKRDPVVCKLFTKWREFWELTGSGRDMPALACALKLIDPPRLELWRQPIFAPCSKRPDCIIQHNYNGTFFDDFHLPRFQEYKPFDGDPSDFHFTHFKGGGNA